MFKLYIYKYVTQIEEFRKKKWLMQNLRIILFRRNEKTKKIIKELIK